MAKTATPAIVMAPALQAPYAKPTSMNVSTFFHKYKDTNKVPGDAYKTNTLSAENAQCIQPLRPMLANLLLSLLVCPINKLQTNHEEFLKLTKLREFS